MNYSRFYILGTVVLVVSFALFIFEMLTGFFYTKFDLQPALEKAIRDKQREILAETARDASSWYQVRDEDIAVWVSVTSRYDVLISEIHPDGAFHFDMKYRTDDGRVRHLDNGFSFDTNRIFLSKHGKDQSPVLENAYAFRIEKPNNFVHVDSLALVLRITPLLKTTLNALANAADLSTVISLMSNNVDILEMKDEDLPPESSFIASPPSVGTTNTIQHLWDLDLSIQ